MKKGAVLIGCGFTPTPIDTQRAIRQGYIKHCSTISILGLDSRVPIELALSAYLKIAQQKNWSVLQGLEVAQISARYDQLMWCIYPVE